VEEELDSNRENLKKDKQASNQLPEQDQSI
jgi:hypothetical protein